MRPPGRWTPDSQARPLRGLDATARSQLANAAASERLINRCTAEVRLVAVEPNGFDPTSAPQRPRVGQPDHGGRRSPTAARGATCSPAANCTARAPALACGEELAKSCGWLMGIGTPEEALDLGVRVSVRMCCPWTGLAR